jgi:hypothetical protein
MNTKRVSIAVAVTALGLAIAPGVASAADSQVPCGTPAKQAVYSTVVTPGTAAVTHDEYQWSSVSEVIEQKWHRYQVDAAAQDAVYDIVHHDAVYVPVTLPGTPAWDEQVLQTAAYDEQVLQTAAWDEQVLQTAAYDEQVVTPGYDEQVLQTAAWDEQVLQTAAWDEQVLQTAAYDQQVLQTAAWDEQVMTSPAVYATEYHFVQKNGKGERWDIDPNWNAQPQQSSGGWIATGETRQGALTSPAVYTTVHHDAVYTTVHHDAVYTTVHHDATPGDTIQVLVTPAWDEQVLVTPATPEVGHWDEVWAVDSPGADWSATGETQTVEGETQLVWAAVSPGEGWTETGLYRTVVDTPAVPDSSSQVLVSPAVPAGAACVVDDPSTGSGETGDPAPANPASAVPAAAGLAKPAAVNATTELAFTGSDPTLMWLGLGFLLSGLGLSAGYRKVAQKR